MKEYKPKPSIFAVPIVMEAIRPWVRPMVLMLIHRMTTSCPGVGVRLCLPASMLTPIIPVLDALLPLACKLQQDEVETPDRIVRMESGRVIFDILSTEIETVLGTLHPDSRDAAHRGIPIAVDFDAPVFDLWISAYTMNRTKSLMPWDGDPSAGLAVASRSIPYPDPEAVYRHAVSLLPIRTPQA